MKSYQLTEEEWAMVKARREQAAREATLRQRIARAYVWPIVGGRKADQGSCSSCQQIDSRHPEGRACDYSCVGV